MVRLGRPPLDSTLDPAVEQFLEQTLEDMPCE
jgi:hypothetical protein